MKKSFLWASLAMLAIVAINVVSCDENEELDDFYSLDLDVTSRTPITRSSMADYESGASQTLGGNTNPYTVPQNEGECMLYAIISIAASKPSLLLTEYPMVMVATRKRQGQSAVTDSQPHKLTIM